MTADPPRGSTARLFDGARRSASAPDDDGSSEVSAPETSRQWNRRVRGESRTEQLDRNLAGLVQELRVVQTGVQVLTGFLLTLPFQSRFAALSLPMRVDYLFVVTTALAATVFLTAPVATHRMLFHRRRLDVVVRGAHRCAMAGMALLGLALIGVAVLVFDLVAGPIGAIVAGIAATVLFAGVWVVLPYRQRAHGDEPSRDGAEPSSERGVVRHCR